MIKILHTVSHDAQKIMDYDKELLNDLQDEPIIHFYDWLAPSITYGYFIDIQEHLNLEHAKSISLGRRPTGGGIVFHMWDMAFSFLMPSTHKNFSTFPLDNYLFVNNCVLEALNEYLNSRGLKLKRNFGESGTSKSFCMANPTKYDLIIDGRKAAGAAQRMTKKGFLHQGTISLAAPDERILVSLLRDEKIVKEILKKTFFMNITDLDRERSFLRDLLMRTLKKNLF